MCVHTTMNTRSRRQPVYLLGGVPLTPMGSRLNQSRQQQAPALQRVPQRRPRYQPVMGGRVLVPPSPSLLTPGGRNQFPARISPLTTRIAPSSTRTSTKKRRRPTKSTSTTRTNTSLRQKGGINTLKKRLF